MTDLSVQVAAEPLSIPPGFGLRAFTPEERLRALSLPEDELSGTCEGLFDVLLVWEPPRRGKQYVIGVDVASGMGHDRSVIDVCRVGDLKEGEEQVAQYVTVQTEPIDLAYIVDPIGRFYQDRRSQLPALVAIELNGMGMGVLSEMKRHIGYINFFRWQHEDAATDEGRFTRSDGWWTSQRSRPLILGRYFRELKAVDPHTGIPNYRINSPHTIKELADFKSPGPLWMAEGDPWDDCVMAGAISVHVAQTLQFEQREPLAETRARIHEEQARAERAGKVLGQNPLGWQQTDISVEELEGTGEGLDFVDMLDNSSKRHYL